MLPGKTLPTKFWLSRPRNGAEWPSVNSGTENCNVKIMGRRRRPMAARSAALRRRRREAPPRQTARTLGKNNQECNQALADPWINIRVGGTAPEGLNKLPEPPQGAEEYNVKMTQAQDPKQVFLNMACADRRYLYEI